MAPRYGDPSGEGVQPHQAPEYDLTVDNACTIKLMIYGELAGASFECPSHPIVVEKQEGQTAITLTEGGMLMDRDFVLQWQPVTGQQPTAALFHELWQGRHYHLLMVMPPHAEAMRQHVPRELILVVDTSGSMHGDSIEQARAALLPGWHVRYPRRPSSGCTEGP